MMNQALDGTFQSNVAWFLVQVVIFSLPPFYIALLRKEIRTTAVYVYVGILLFVGGFLGAVFSIPLTPSVTVSGGSIAYGALLYSAILLIFIADDILAMRNVILLVISINLFKFIFFSLVTFLLSQSAILNPYNTDPELFAVSARFMLVGGALIILELLILLYAYDKIKTRVKNYYALSALYVLGFIAVLLLDGVLFPALAFGIDPVLIEIVVGGVGGKLAIATAYSVPLFAFTLLFRSRMAPYLTTSVPFRLLFTASRETLLAELGRQQHVVQEQQRTIVESERRLQIAVKAANVGLWDWSLQSDTMSYSPEWKSQLGYQVDEISDDFSEWESRLHPDDRAPAMATLEAYLDEQGATYNNEFRLRHKDGSYRWILAQGSLLQDETGQPVRMLGSHIDFTPIKESEETVKAIEAQYHSLFETAGDYGVFRVRALPKGDAFGQIILISPSIHDIIGIKDLSYLSTFLDNIHPEDVPKLRVLQTENYRNEREFEQQIRIYHPQKEAWRWLHIIANPARDKRDGHLYVNGVIIDITSQKETERALQDSESFLKAIFEHSLNPIMVANNAGNYVLANQAAADVFGYPVETLLQMSVSDLQTVDTPTALEQYNAYLATGRAHGEFEFVRPDGEVRTVSYHAIRIRDDLNLSVMTDVSEQRRTFARLEASERKYRNLVETTQDLVWAIDAEMRITFINQAAHHIYGRSPEEMIGRLYTDFIPPEEAESNASSWETAIQNNDRIFNFENWVLHKDGTPVCLNANAVLIRDEDGNIVGSMGTSHDITERIKREQQLQYQAYLLANVSEAIISTDPDFKIRTWNKAAEKLYGWQAEEAIGLPVGAVVPTLFSGAVSEAQVRQAFMNAGSWQGEVVQTCRDGTRRQILSTVAALKDDSGEITGTVAVNRDISDRKAAEEARKALLTQLKLAISSAQLGLWELDLATNQLTWNEQLFAMYAITPEQFAQNLDGWRDQVHPEDRASANAELGKLFEGQSVSDVAFRIIRPSGEIRYIMASGTPIFNDDGELIRLIGINADVTEAKEREIAIEESEVRLKQAQKIGQFGSWEIDVETNMMLWSDQVYEILGATPNGRHEVPYDAYLRYVHPDDREKLRAAQIAALRGNEDLNVEHRIRRADGTIRYVHERSESMPTATSQSPKLIGTIQDITDRKTVEMELLQRNQFIETILHHLPIGLAVNFIDDGKTTYMNAAFEEVYGWPRDRLTDVDQFFEQVYPDPAYRKEIQAQIARDVETGNPARMTWEGMKITTQEGEKRVVFAKNIPIPDQNLMISTVQDITARHQAEQQLQKYAQQLEALHEIDRAILAEDSPERVAEATVHHLAGLLDCERISAAWLDETGERATILAAFVKGTTRLGQGVSVQVERLPGVLEDLRHGKIFNMPDLEQMSGLSSTLDALLAEGVRSHIMVPLSAAGRLLGSLNLGSANVGHFDESHVQLVQEVATQLSIALQQTRLNEAEREQRALAETLQETAVTLVGSLNLEETLTTILNLLARVVPYDLAQVLLIQGEELTVGARRSVLPAEPDTKAGRQYTEIPLLYRSLQSGEPIVLSDPRGEKEQNELPGMVAGLSSYVGIPLVARDVLVGFLTVGKMKTPYLPHEISAISTFAQQAALAIEKASILRELERSVESLRQAQTQLVRAARLSAIGETAAGVAHQINNPLTSVIVDSHLLLKNLPDSHPARPSAKAVYQAAIRAANVVERLLDLSRTRPENKSPVDIAESIKESVLLVKVQMPANVHLSVEFQEDLPPVSASPDHLQDLWINLLLNARDAVRQQANGRIRVTASHSEDERTVTVSIRDNGEGISAHDQQKVFEPFYTTKTRGTGLGLSVCQDIVLHHDGQIRVRSTPGEGSTFQVTLPQ